MVCEHPGGSQGVKEGPGGMSLFLGAQVGKPRIPRLSQAVQPQAICLTSLSILPVDSNGDSNGPCLPGPGNSCSHSSLSTPEPQLQKHSLSQYSTRCRGLFQVELSSRSFFGDDRDLVRGHLRRDSVLDMGGCVLPAPSIRQGLRSYK